MCLLHTQYTLFVHLLVFYHYHMGCMLHLRLLVVPLSCLLILLHTQYKFLNYHIDLLHRNSKCYLLTETKYM